MFNRIKRAVKAFSDPNQVVLDASKLPQNVLDAIAEGQLVSVPLVAVEESLGDGKAELLPDMTEAEYDDYLRNEENGWSKLKQSFGLK